MGHLIRNKEDNSAEGDVKYGGLLPEISEENFSMWPRDCSCDIWVKNMLLSAIVWNSWPEAKVEKI